MTHIFMYGIILYISPTAIWIKTNCHFNTQAIDYYCEKCDKQSKYNDIIIFSYRCDVDRNCKIRILRLLIKLFWLRKTIKFKMYYKHPFIFNYITKKYLNPIWTNWKSRHWLAYHFDKPDFVYSNYLLNFTSTCT